MNLHEAFQWAQEKKIAIGHFNISSMDALWGIFNAAKSLDVPVVIGLSEGERDFFGEKQAVDVVRSIRIEQSYPMFINADHTYSVERVKRVIDLGYDSVIFDGAKLGLEENIVQARECVEYGRQVNPEIMVELELGYIGSSSKLLDEIPEGASISEELMAKPADARRLISETGAHLLSPAVGNIHGMLKNAPNPELHIDRIREIKEAAGVPLVLHGGSGISDQNFKDSIEAGISMIHINTEIRRAWRAGLESALAEDANEIAPYKLLNAAQSELQKIVSERLRLFHRMD